MEISFIPYRIYQSNLQQIENFEELTDIAYGIAEQLLFRHPIGTIPKSLLPESRVIRGSYGPGDISVKDVKELCRWVELSEYAVLSGKTQDVILRQADDGQLGPLERHPETGSMLLIWPESFQNRPRNRLPTIGKKIFRVKLAGKARQPIELDTGDVANFEVIQQQFLFLAHALGEPTEVRVRAEEMLYRSCLNLHWTAFEVFIRSTVHDLFRLHPEAIAWGKRAKSNTISYEEILSLSQDFSDAAALRSALVQRAIERAESEGRSVHGLINLLTSEFQFQEDPYSSWYVFQGNQQTTNYTQLMMVKDTRNALIHDAGGPTPNLFAKYPDIPSHDGKIIVTEDFYIRCALVLDSVAYKLSVMIERGEYRVQS
jgi:hypothetical protein